MRFIKDTSAEAYLFVLGIIIYVKKTCIKKFAFPQVLSFSCEFPKWRQESNQSTKQKILQDCCVTTQKKKPIGYVFSQSTT